jgi:hypothetical protein
MIRRLILLLACVLPGMLATGCVRVSNGRIVPESLPYRLALVDRIGPNSTDDFQAGTMFDSVARTDVIHWMMNRRPSSWVDDLRSIHCSARGVLAGEDQLNLSNGRCPGI